MWPTFAKTLKAYSITKVQGDRYGGEWVIAPFKQHGITYEPSAKPKSDLYRDLLPMLNSRKTALLDNQRLSNQLLGLERRTARSGKDSNTRRTLMTTWPTPARASWSPQRPAPGPATR